MLALSPARLRLRPRLHQRCLHTHNEPYNVLFFGRDEFSCAVLARLHAARALCGSITLATTPNILIGRYRDTLSVSPLKTLGLQLGLPVLEVPRARAELRAWAPPPPFASPAPSNVLITASFGRILPAALLARFAPQRRLNVHPSALPAYRGPAPLQRALLDGAARTGVGVIEMGEVLGKKERERRGDGRGGVDEGAVWGARDFEVPEDCDFATLRDALAAEGGELLVDVLRRMRADPLFAPTPQAPLDASTPHVSLILPADALVDFTALSAPAIVRRHRAIAHHKPLTAVLAGSAKHVQLHDPRVHLPSQVELEPGAARFNKRAGAVLVGCAEGSVLSVGALKSESRRLLEGREWFVGAPGERVPGVGKVVRFGVPSADAFERRA